jgi:hypothetical protein
MKTMGSGVSARLIGKFVTELNAFKAWASTRALLVDTDEDSADETGSTTILILQCRWDPWRQRKTTK